MKKPKNILAGSESVEAHMEEDIDHRVKAIAADHLNLPLSRFEDGAEIVRDLGLNGESLSGLLQACAEAFGIGFPEGAEDTDDDEFRFHDLNDVVLHVERELRLPAHAQENPEAE